MYRIASVSALAHRAFPLVAGAPEGIRTPNLLTYSPVCRGLVESLRIWLYQAFRARCAIPIWVSLGESTNVCTGKVTDSRCRRSFAGVEIQDASEYHRIAQ